jgi:alpha-galactosidase
MSRPLDGITIRTKEHREVVYLNCKEGSWFDAIQDFTLTYDEETGVQIPPLHPNAADPLYCTWYAHGPMATQEKVLAELDMVRDLGFRNYVIDEGWFGREAEAWQFRGDYTPNPEKFPDMRKVVDAVHKRGMNILLWVSPFQIAPKSSKYPELKGYLNKRDRLGELPYFLPMLGPWVTAAAKEPDVEDRMELCPRTGITETYVPELVAGLIRDYNLDGLKIDFIDQVSVLPCTADHEHIYPTVGEAMARTVRAMDVAIRQVKPDAIIEFRLPYANIFLRPFATLYRAQDCPWDWDQNRRQCAWIKSFTPGYGPLPEADYISWRRDESVENVAKAVESAILYCVPSIGMDFTKLPESHLKIVKQWLRFYQEHKEEIIRGRWQPLEFDPHTSTFAIYGDRTTFVGMFKDVLGRIVLGRSEACFAPEYVYLFNGTSASSIHTRLEPMEGEYELIVFDLFLEEIGRSKMRSLDGGLNLSLTVPEAGMVEIRRRR